MKRLLNLLTIVLFSCWSLTLRGDEPKAGQSFQIRNLEYGNLLRPLNASTQDGAPIVLYPAAPWKCMTWKFLADGDAFALQNHFTSKTLAGGANPGGQPDYVTQVPWSDEAGERPIWRFIKLEDGSYRIADTRTGRVLTAIQDDDLGVRIALEPSGDRPGQRWEVLKAPERLTL